MISAKSFLEKFMLTMDMNPDKFKRMVETAINRFDWDAGSKAAMQAMLDDPSLSAARAKAIWNAYNTDNKL